MSLVIVQLSVFYCTCCCCCLCSCCCLFLVVVGTWVSFFVLSLFGVGFFVFCFFLSFFVACLPATLDRFHRNW